MRIFGNGSAECDGGITIARGNPGTLILNSLIYANGRNGIATLDVDGGPHAIIGNTIHGNAWKGVSITRNHDVLLVNNAITGNGTAAGSTGGRFGVTRESSSTPNPAGIRLLNNLVCGNRLGEINGPVLDGTDASNLTPTGAGGPGVVASPGCEVAANVYANAAGADFTLAPGSPAIDRGMDPRTLGLGSVFDALLLADFSAEGARLSDALFDIGALEFVITTPDTRAPTTVFLRPATNAFVHGMVTVDAQATDDTGVASLALSVDFQGLDTSLTRRRRRCRSPGPQPGIRGPSPTAPTLYGDSRRDPFSR